MCLTKMLIKEHMNGNNEILKFTKTDLLRFCIRLLKMIEREKEKEK